MNFKNANYVIHATTTDAIAAALHEMGNPDSSTIVAIRDLAGRLRQNAATHSVKPNIVLDAVDKQNPIIVFVLGGPGSGKGTVCPRLVEEFGFAHLSVGELLRGEVALKSAIGLEVESILKSGGLVSDSLALSIIKSAISRIVDALPGKQAKILLDGFPRTLEQAIEFEASIYPASRVIWLTCAEELLTERILARGRTSGRQDDNAESIIIRLQTFNTNTNKIKDYFESQESKKLSLIDASLSPEEVYDQVKSLFVPSNC